MQRILCLWFPEWAVQRSHDKGQGALAVYARDARRGECLVALNQGASQAGMRRGMPLTEARGLLRHARARVRLAKHDAVADRQQLTELAAHAERYSPLIGLGAAYPPPLHCQEPAYDCLLLDVTSIGALFGGEQALAEAVLADSVWQRFQVRAAIAERISTAWALAHFARDSPAIASDGWQAMSALPLEALRLPDEQVGILRDLGLETVEQLAALPIAALAERFGSGLVQQLEQARGERAELLTPIRPTPEFSAQWLLEYPVSDLATLQTILAQLAQRVGDGLRACDQGALQLTCRLDVADSAPVVVRIGLFRPTADAKHFLELLLLQGEALRLRGAVGRVGLSVTQAARLEHRQRQLFVDAWERQDDELAALVNRLSNRLGRERVTRPKLTRDPLPERSYELLPLTDHAGALTKSSKLKQVGAIAVAVQRPWTMLSQPMPIAVVAPDGLPATFSCRDQQHVVLRCWGPERIETSWWRGPSARRDYYQVEAEDGCRFWLFRELRSGQWYLHGHFD